MSKKKVSIFTDGACRGNPGPGGWGALLRYNGHEKRLKGAEANTTNNRMELTAAIKALEEIKETCEIVLTTDSNYVRHGITEWLPGWVKKGWKNANKKPVANRDLWETLDELSQQHEMTWKWVKGHADHPENERCDELARMALEDYR